MTQQQPIGGLLVLRHASKRQGGPWGPDDYDVIDSTGRSIGRIYFRPGCRATALGRGPCWDKGRRR